jgi:hypothetical protein
MSAYNFFIAVGVSASIQFSYQTDCSVTYAIVLFFHFLQYYENKQWQLMKRRNSPETGKENMQVCPAMTHSRLKTRSPWMQVSESSFWVSQIFCRFVHAEKQRSACNPRPATRQHIPEQSELKATYDLSGHNEASSEKPGVL